MMVLRPVSPVPPPSGVLTASRPTARLVTAKRLFPERRVFQWRGARLRRSWLRQDSRNSRELRFGVDRPPVGWERLPVVLCKGSMGRAARGSAVRSECALPSVVLEIGDAKLGARSRGDRLTI